MHTRQSRTCASHLAPRLRVPPFMQSPLARPPTQPKTQNGLRNQLNPHPYKPPTAQCESAHPLSKTNHTPKRNSQTTQANSPNALSQAADASCSWLSRVTRQKGVLTAQNFVSRPLPRLSRQQQKTPETPPIPTPKTPKKHPCQHTPRYLYHLSHQPNYQRKTVQKEH